MSIENDIKLLAQIKSNQEKIIKVMESIIEINGFLNKIIDRIEVLEAKK